MAARRSPRHPSALGRGRPWVVVPAAVVALALLVDVGAAAPAAAGPHGTTTTATTATTTTTTTTATTATTTTTVSATGDGVDPSLAALERDVADRLLVRWAADATPRDRARVLDAIGDVEVVAITDRIDAVRLRGEDLRQAAASLADDAAVEVAEPDQVVLAPAAVDRPVVLSSVLLPPDELFDRQWGLRNTGQQVGPMGGTATATAGTDVRLLDAWPVTRGQPRVRVAVIDSAVDASHPDLLGAISQQVDVTGGLGTGTEHGTAVTSVIAARSSIGGGMVGVAPEVQVVSIAAFTGGGGSDPGASTVSLIVAAFEAAFDLDVDVINASWVAPRSSDLLRAVVADAGVPVVAAAGNNAVTLLPDIGAFPAAYDLPNLVTVTSIGPTGLVPGFANVGAAVVDVGAPGQLIVGAVDDGQHAWMNGTSFAAPHVSGALALARSVAPDATPSELVDAVRWTSRPEQALAGRTITGGMLDVGALVAGVQRPVCRPDMVAPVAFPDLGAGNVHRNGIACLVGNEVMTGRPDGGFDPATPVTREQVASLLARIVDQVVVLPPAPPAGFVDVPPDGTHAAAIDRLVDLGIARGDDDGRFRPRDPVTRGQLATLLVGTYDLLIGDPQPPSRAWFRDTPGTTHADPVHRARDLGIVAGVDRLTFDPRSATRRDQVASLVARFLDAVGRQGAVL